jgi:hypothetical protein
LLTIDVLPVDASLQFTPKDGGSVVRVRADSSRGILLSLGRYDVVANFPRCIEYRDSLVWAPTSDSLLRVRLPCVLGGDGKR